MMLWKTNVPCGRSVSAPVCYGAPSEHEHGEPEYLIKPTENHGSHMSACSTPALNGIWESAMRCCWQWFRSGQKRTEPRIYRRWFRKAKLFSCYMKAYMKTHITWAKITFDKPLTANSGRRVFFGSGSLLVWNVDFPYVFYWFPAWRLAKNDDFIMVF